MNMLKDVCDEVSGKLNDSDDWEYDPAELYSYNEKAGSHVRVGAWLYKERGQKVD